MRISIDVLGEDRIEREFLRIGENATDLSAGFNAALDRLEAQAEEQFRSQGGQSGGWAPLAASTLRQKSTALILEETGALRASVTGGDGEIRDVRPDGADYGTTVPYAPYHHSKAPRSHLPRRPLLEVDEALKRAMMRDLQRALFDGDGVSRPYLSDVVR